MIGKIIDYVREHYYFDESSKKFIFNGEGRVTQTEFLRILSEYDYDEFYSVLPVSISRWKAGKNPGPKRSVEVLKALMHLGVNVYNLDQFSPSKKSDFDTVLKDNFLDNQYYVQIEKYLERTMKDNNIVLHDLRYTDNRAYFAKQILDFDHEIWPSEKTVTTDILLSWASFPSNSCYYISHEGEYAGHCIVLNLTDSIFSELMNQDMEEADINIDFELGNNRYVYSIYGRNKRITAKLMSKEILRILKEFNSHKMMGGLCVTPDGIKLAEKFQMNRINSDILLGTDIEWATYSTRIEDMLLSHKFLKLLI